MEANKNIDIQSEKNDKGYTYVFKVKEAGGMQSKGGSKFRRKIWQVFPSVCGSMMAVPFGIMLGWPSPTYPQIITTINPLSPVPIDIDQSAMIAGFLMIGNSLGTPFSFLRRFSPKYGIMLGVVLMTIGWALMWQAKDIYWLLISRLFVGLGHGLALGQLKIYISQICELKIAQFLIKQINLYTFIGVIIAFALGPFVNFLKFGILSMIITIMVLFLAIFLPSTPRDLIKTGKMVDAKKLIVFLSPEVKVEEEIDRIRQDIAKPFEHLSFLDLFKQKKLNFIKFAILVFFQQFTGIISTVVYSQILFTESQCPNPEFCALLYSVTFFLANAYGIFFSTTFSKRSTLLFSSVTVSLVLLVKILVLVFEVYKYWNYTSVIVMLVFVVVHTVGLGNVPFTMIGEYFPKSGAQVASQFFVIFHSMLGLIITKIFQVMYDRLGLYTPFCLFLGMALGATVFIFVFVKSDSEDEKS